MSKKTYGSQGTHERKEIIRSAIFSFVIVLFTAIGIGLVGVWNAPESSTTAPVVAAGFPGTASPFPSAPPAPSTTSAPAATSSSSAFPATSSSTSAG